MATAEIRRHWSAVTALGCAVCRTRQDVTIHHVHAGSCAGLSGMGLKANDWMVIGLCPRHHTGAAGIDGSRGVETWEAMFGPQLLHLLRTGLALGINPFDQAGADLQAIYRSACCAISRGRPPQWASVG